uniref:Uncharacterized protein AlNc14C55G4205 n=1 Tax=Albugo laibachii Nc14 TaxID=890382 RepID=F0WC18_9STRA|nr:conserved hypothetical protein [Albugo laibachii Nc14]|eukprot:CCA18699.1 conserved hypothetical protein [Albugo laibachii Nc14]
MIQPPCRPSRNLKLAGRKNSRTIVQFPMGRLSECHDLFGPIIPFLEPVELENYCLAVQETQRGIQNLINTSRWKYFLRVDFKIGDTFFQASSVDKSQYTRYRSSLSSKTEVIKSPVESDLLSGCLEMKNYLAIATLHRCFMDNVYITEGDIGCVSEIDGHQVDCVAFPTSSGLLNPGIGVAGRIHSLAGPTLNSYLMNNRTNINQKYGSFAFATPAFDMAGVKKLIHCVGPYYNQSKCDSKLYEAYVLALQEIWNSDGIDCAAFVSISTGNNRYPPEEASILALTAMLDMMRKFRWRTRLAVVCIDRAIYQSFLRAKVQVWNTLASNYFPFPNILS